MTLVLAALSPPAGLRSTHGCYFAIFAGVIAALVTEPLPKPGGRSDRPVADRTAVALCAVRAGGPRQARLQGGSQTISWALSGFSSTTVWLVGGAFMFALGYQKTGLGRRIALLLVRALGRNTLLVGYATTLADAVLAPFTPSNTARSAGIIFPIVSNLPSLYNSQPNDASARRFGGYIMWTTFAAGCVTSSLFMTACAPNFLAIEFIDKIVHVHISYLQWMKASLPFALPLLLALPLLAYVLYPPEVKRSTEVTTWAGSELRKMGSDFDARDHPGGAGDRRDRALGDRRQLHRCDADRAGGDRVDAGVRRRRPGTTWRRTIPPGPPSCCSQRWSRWPTGCRAPGSSSGSPSSSRRMSAASRRR